MEWGRSFGVARGQDGALAAARDNFVLWAVTAVHGGDVQVGAKLLEAGFA